MAIQLRNMTWKLGMLRLIAPVTNAANGKPVMGFYKPEF